MIRCRKCDVILIINKNIIKSKLENSDYICRPCDSTHMKKWRSDNKETTNRRYHIVRKTIFIMMGSKCNKCGNTDLRVLQINHINGDGRIELKNNANFYRDIYTGKRKIDDLELLCANCNILFEYERGRRFAN